MSEGVSEEVVRFDIRGDPAPPVETIAESLAAVEPALDGSIAALIGSARLDTGRLGRMSTTPGRGRSTGSLTWEQLNRLEFLTAQSPEQLLDDWFENPSFALDALGISTRSPRLVLDRFIYSSSGELDLAFSAAQLVTPFVIECFIRPGMAFLTSHLRAWQTQHRFRRAAANDDLRFRSEQRDQDRVVDIYVREAGAAYRATVASLPPDAPVTILRERLAVFSSVMAPVMDPFQRGYQMRDRIEQVTQGNVLRRPRVAHRKTAERRRTDRDR